MRTYQRPQQGTHSIESRRRAALTVHRAGNMLDAVLATDSGRDEDYADLVRGFETGDRALIGAVLDRMRPVMPRGVLAETLRMAQREARP